ncbi:uncharacterized protein LOC123524560 [Mercenaria mercenaria]|uniref:uncharacterized protein LOC123524560 n=1 Tax=Mercenaria mercenaria TaxID=6596 RepID=UPI00234EEE80|nr:uncharacterized protein LOC123524560 [Mercenaria mercenaria]
MDKKMTKPFMYIRNAEMLNDSQGREANAHKEADDIIKTIIPDTEDEKDEDEGVNHRMEETKNDSKVQSNWTDQIVEVFKSGPLKWKPTFDKKHKSSCDRKAVSTFIVNTYDVGDNCTKTNYLCGQTEAAIKAGSEGHVQISVGKTNIATVKYDADIKGNVKLYHQGLVYKRSQTDGKERDIKIANCAAKEEIVGNLQGSAEFNAFDYKWKVEAEAKGNTSGNVSFVGLNGNVKKTPKGIEGHTKPLHVKTGGKANFQVKGSVGKQKVKLNAKAKGKVKFKAIDGKFVLAAKKPEDGGIYIPGVHGTLGEVKAKGEADFKGKEMNEKAKASGEAKLPGMQFRTLNVDMRREKDNGTTVKTKASVVGAILNVLNLEAVGNKKGNKAVA